MRRKMPVNAQGPARTGRLPPSTIEPVTLQIPKLAAQTRSLQGAQPRAAVLSTCSTRGNDLVFIEQAVKKCAKHMRGMAPICVVKIDAGPRWRPISKNPLQLSKLDRLVNALVVIGIDNSEALQCSLYSNILTIRDQRPIHGDLNFPSFLLELPARYPIAAGKSPVDAGMPAQVDGRCRLAAQRKIARRCGDDHLDIGGETNDVHVFLEPSSHANARIEATGDDVTEAIVNHDVEHHIRVSHMKSSKPWGDDLLYRHAQRIDSNCSCSPAC